jgi:hypothetical protein
VDDVGFFYNKQDQASGTHLALRWKGRVRIIVPREVAAQDACWNIFSPGCIRFPLRTVAHLPRLLGAVSCVEAARLASIREAIGKEAGLSCCRAGAPGPWSKDTILFLDRQTFEPLYIVKAGAGEAVDRLLRNEANWLLALRDQPALIDHIPDLVVHRSGAYLSFVAETPLPGKIEYQFGELHVEFLLKLQEYSRQTMLLQESGFYRNMSSRLKDLSGLLSEAWSTRLDKGMRHIEQSLSGRPILLVAAHNDFTPWNIRVERGVAGVFDWEYADHEQLPLFDPLHFALMPMALKNRAMANIIRTMRQTLLRCEHWFGKEPCYESQTQALAYLMSVCAHYLWSVQGQYDRHPVLDSYAEMIDHLCLCKSVL